MTRTTRLWAAFVLNLVLVGGLVTTGIMAQSLAVPAAGGDGLACTSTIAVALFAHPLRNREASTSDRTYATPSTYPAFLTALPPRVVGFVVIEAVLATLRAPSRDHADPWT